MMNCVSVFPKYVSHERGSQKKKEKRFPLVFHLNINSYKTELSLFQKKFPSFSFPGFHLQIFGENAWNSKGTVSFTLRKAQTIERLDGKCFPLAPTTIFPPTLKVNTLFTIMPLGRLLTYENVQNVCKDPSRSAKRCRLQGI